MKLFVTGSAGFVGSHLAELVPCIGSPALDIRAPESVAKAVADAKPDCIIHLAAQTSVAESLRNPRETYEINFMGTFNLLESLKSAGFSGKMLFVSSGDD
jgi:GDP-4-dehydro-6-deoxy-D-mannose reductase